MKGYYRSIFYALILIAVCVSLAPVAGFGQNQADYTGSEACGTCHVNELKFYKAHGHSKAEGGVATETGIGCESCHSAGKAHSEIPMGDLQKLKKEEGDTKINTDNAKMAMCVECHAESDNGKLQLVSSVLIAPLQEYNEMMNSKKPTIGMTCTMCHDKHQTGKEGGKMARECLACHTGDTYGKPVEIKAMQGLACEDCHMPYAVSGDNNTMIGEYQKGTYRSHIFGITVDDDYQLDDGTKHASLEEVTAEVRGEKHELELARLTVDMTCAACHKSGEAHDMDRKDMIKYAKRIHD
ncbi:hypothetical protein ACFL6K_02090 [Candidatus Latescibacterota bacterium]